MFGHFGIEWNVLTLDDAELAELTGWVDLYKRHRGLLHGGDFVRIDHDDPHAYVHGVLAADRTSALVAYVQLSSAQALFPRPVRVPELDPERAYRVNLLDVPGEGGGRHLMRGAMAVEAGLVLTGRQLAAHGVRLPVVNPESIALVWIEAVPGRPRRKYRSLPARGHPPGRADVPALRRRRRGHAPGAGRPTGQLGVRPVAAAPALRPAHRRLGPRLPDAKRATEHHDHR